MIILFRYNGILLLSFIKKVEREGGGGESKAGVRRLCADGEMGFEEARRACLDRNVWRSMIDKV